MARFKDSLEWTFGTWGEKVVRAWLQSRGYRVIHTARIEDGGAPSLVGAIERDVLPDMEAVKDGSRRWVEVKAKEAAVFYQKTGRPRHGIDQYLWPQYLKVEHDTGSPGDLCIVVKRTSLILIQSFAVLDQVKSGHSGGDVAKWWWDEDAFERFGLGGDEVRRLGGPPPAPLPRATHPWDRETKPEVQQVNLRI